MTAVGFEHTPLRNGALSNRLRPLGQTVLVCVMKLVYSRKAGSGQLQQKAQWRQLVLRGQHFSSVAEVLNTRTDDTLAERSRRWPAKLMGFPHVGSNLWKYDSKTAPARLCERVPFLDTLHRSDS